MSYEGGRNNGQGVYNEHGGGYQGSGEESGQGGGGSGQQRERKDPATMTTEERFDYAKTYRLGFGKHKGLDLNQIAVLDILYLGWLSTQNWLNDSCRAALDTFLAHPRVAADLADAVAINEIQVKARQRGGRY